MSELTREIRDKRIAVAKDVIERVRSEKVNVKGCGGYLFVPNSLMPECAVNKESDLRDLLSVLDAANVPCKACQLGALLVSKARLYDNVPLGNLAATLMSGYGLSLDREDATENLLDVFDHETMNNLECAFEGGAFVAHNAATPMMHGAVKFGEQFDDRADRCVAIMENLIENDGEFVVEPSDGPEFSNEYDPDDEDCDDDLGYRDDDEDDYDPDDES